MVLSETQPGAGLTLLRVLRKGLELGSCLGVDCEPGIRLALRLPSAPSSGDSPFQGIEGHAYTLSSGTMNPLRLGFSQLRRIKYLSGLEETKGERGELARQRHAGEFFAHATLDHSVIEIL